MNISLNDFDGKSNDKSIILQFFIPITGLFGIIGNLLNLRILQLNSRNHKSSEKCALVGMFALALSNIMFCIGRIPSLTLSDTQPNFYYFTRNFQYYWFHLEYYYSDIWIKTSTYYTVLTSGMQYLAICHPFKVNYLLSRKKILIVICLIPLIWSLALLPLIWSFRPITITTNTSIRHSYTLSIFNDNNPYFYYPVTCCWAVFGYGIPVLTLAFFNINLIRALRKSKSFRSRFLDEHKKEKDWTNQLTITLILLVLMYTILVSPSEIFHFYSEIFGKRDNPLLISTVLNFLQTIHFSCTFLLYVFVNKVFRRILFVSCSTSSINVNDPQSTKLVRKKDHKKKVLLVKLEKKQFKLQNVTLKENVT